MGYLRKTIKAFVISICIFIIFTLLLALLIKFTPYQEVWAFAGEITLLSIVSFIFGMLEGKIIGKRGFIIGILAATVLICVILLGLSMILFNEIKLGNIDKLFAVPIIFGAIGGIVGTNINK